MAHICVLLCRGFIHLHLPAARPICGSGAKSAAAAIAVFTHIMRGFQSTSLASVAQNVIIQSDAGFLVHILFKNGLVSSE